MELYSYVPPPGENIPISVEPLPVDNSVPTEDEIKWAVKCLRNHRSRRPYGMRSEHLKRWLAVARNQAKEKVAVGEETMEGNNRGVYGAYVGVQLGEVGLSGTNGVQGGATDGGGHVAGGGPDSQGGKLIP